VSGPATLFGAEVARLIAEHMETIDNARDRITAGSIAMGVAADAYLREMKLAGWSEAKALSACSLLLSVSWNYEHAGDLADGVIEAALELEGNDDGSAG
jgi:hypothetical protein